MRTDNYMSPTELRAVAYYLEAVQPLWRALTEGPWWGVAVEEANEGLMLVVYDSNGDTLGHISWAADANGAAFYPGEIEIPPEDGNGHE